MRALITNTALSVGTKGGNLQLIPIYAKPSLLPPQVITLKPGESATIETNATISRWIIEEA
jgi:hypothetical protein